MPAPTSPPLYTRSFLGEPDWQSCEETLYTSCQEALARFIKENPDTTIAYFAFDSEPAYGYVLICLDTLENSRGSAEKWHLRKVEQIRKNLEKSEGGSLSVSSLTLSQEDFCNNTGDFVYQGYGEVWFPEWEAFQNSSGFPKYERKNRWDLDYMETRVAVLFWRILDRLIQENAFTNLKLASPFRLGYGFHDRDQVVLRILNWPDSIGTT